ncbi:MAG: histidine utilization repressor [Gammaproteobacteria bacterium]|nr:histidine utilization repressor [Gammaproteobacteria bacterium]
MKNPSRYQTAKHYILNGISQGQWAAGQRVPSENELSDLCQVSRMTARRALQELFNEGTLIRIKGKGSFVSEDKQQSSILQIRSIAAEIKASGHQHHAKVVVCKKQKTDSFLANTLSIPESSECGYTQLLHFSDHRPIQLEKRWVNLNHVPEYLQQDFNQITPGEYLSRLVPVTEAEHQIEAIIGDDSTRELLKIESDEAILMLQRTTWCHDNLISYAKLYHPGNRYRLGTRFQPEKTN